MTYKKYDPALKQMIIKSGNPNLFPELNIPRTTALYWIKKCKEPVSSILDTSLLNEFSRLQRDVYHQKAINLMLSKLLKAFLKEKLSNGLANKSNRKDLISIIDEMSSILSLKEILDILDISKSTYYRYRIEVMGCPRTGRFCSTTNKVNQISNEEQGLMIKLATDKNLAQLSVKSLMYYAQRECKWAGKTFVSGKGNTAINCQE